MTSLKASTQGHLAMLGFSALVAGSFSLGARTANLIDPAALTMARFVVAVVTMAIAAQAFGPGFRRAHLRGSWRWLLLGSIYAIYFVLMFEALKTATSVSTAAVFTLSPILSAVIGWIILRQRTTHRMAIAIAIGALGALWVIFRGSLENVLRFDIGRGELIYFLACIFHAALPALMRKTNRGEPPMVATALLLTGGMITLLPWGIPRALATDWAAVPPLVWTTILYTAVAASAATALLMSFASQRLPGAKVMAYTYLVPSWVIGWEIALGGSAPPMLVLGGIALTIVALVLLLKDEAVSPAPRGKDRPETA